MATTQPPELWLYVDAATGQQRGPLPAATLKRLVRRGLLQPQQFVWTQRLTEWQALAQVDTFAAYCATWSSFWYYMVDDPTTGASATKQAGPVSTKELVALFLDGDVDGMTLVWTTDMAKWLPISDVPALKEFLHDANEDQAREEEVLEKQSAVATEDQVYTDAKVEAFEAEDGTQYVYDAETSKWVTPADKIEDDLAALREAAGETRSDHDATAALKAAKAQGSAASDSDPGATPAATAGPERSETSVEATAAGAGATDAKPKKKKKKKSDKWRKSKTKTWVYVNGLPLDVTVAEVHDHFAKCGVIQHDVVTGAPRIKLYENKAFGGLNGDASVCFMKEASVELAVQLLDKSLIRPEWPIDVSPAVFEQKGAEFVKRKKVKLDSRAKVKKFEQEKALSWNEGADDERNGLRIVVIKHMFTPEEIEDEAYEAELRADILAECLKLGDVSKITLFSKHVDGVVVVKFESTGSAATCIDVMNGRFFAGRKLTCAFWDGTDYTYRESKDEEKERAEKFSEWLEQGSSSSEDEEDGTDEASGGGSNGQTRGNAKPTASASATQSTEGGERKQANDATVDSSIHAGRVMPDSDDDSDSDAADDAAEATSEAVHAGRVMPDLDDIDDDDDD